MKQLCIAALVTLVAGCHLDKLVGGSGGGSPPPSHGTPVGLAFMTQPQTAQAGQPIGPVKVSIVDSAGHPVAGDTTTVAVTLGANPGGAKLHGDTTAHPANGVATFTNLWLDNAGNNYTLAASAGSLSGTSNPFDIMPPPPTTGTLNVTTNTTANPPASGYTVSVSSAGSQSIGASQTVTFPGVSPGTHAVTLGNVPSNCAVSESNPQNVTITAGQATSATFTITCTPPPPTTGDIAVTTTTSGPSQPSGYTVALDAGSGQAIAASGTYTFTNVPVGSHSVTLSAVPANCTASGGTSRTLSVTAGGTATVTFSVTCVAPPPTTGDLIVTTATTGSNLPSSNYTVAMDGGASQSIGLNTSVTFSAVPAGTHTVTLSGVPSNCTVSPGTSQNATVPAGGQVTAPFAISCTAPPPVDHPPVVNAGGNQTILIGSFTLNASFTDQDHDGPWSYTIDWDDGGSVTTGNATNEGAITATHSYGALSTHNVRVTVTDSHGLSGSDTAVITVVASLAPPGSH